MMHLIDSWIGLFILSLGMAFTPARPGSEPDATVIPAATRLVDAGRYREALPLLLDGSSKAEADPGSRILLGRVYLGLGRYPEADQSLTAPGPLLTEPTRLEALSRVAEARGDLDRALGLLTQAVEAKQKSLASTTSLDGASALTEWRTLLGALAFRAGRLDLAKDQFQKGITLVGEAHAKLHALDVPHDERDPRLFAGGATAGLARVYGAQGDLARAERSWRGVMARTDDPAVLACLVAFYQARDDAKSAQRHLERALRLAAAKPAHRRTQALLLGLNKTTLDQALTLAREVYEDGPDVRATDTFAWVLHLSDQDDRAAATLQPVLDLGSQDPEVLYHAGVIAQSRGRLADARRLLARSRAINPGFDPVAARDARRRLDQLP